MDGGVRTAAAHALGKIGRPAIPFLLENLSKRDPHARASAALALGELGPQAGGSVPLLAQLTRHKDKDVQRECVRALGRIKDPAALLPLVRLIRLKEQTSELRAAAIIAIGEFGSAGAPATPLLIGILKDLIPARTRPSPGSATKPRPPLTQGQCDLYLVSCQTLARIGATAVPALCTLAGDDNLELRKATFTILAEIGPLSRPAVPAIVKSLATSNEDVRFLAAYALGEIGSGANPALPSLIRCLRDLSPQVRVQAAASLNKIKPVNSHTAPVLAAALKDRQKDIRYAAVLALGEWGISNPNAVPLLGVASNDSDASIRIAAIEQLQAIPPSPNSIIPALLRKCLQDKEEIVRQAAQAALRQSKDMR